MGGLLVLLAVAATSVTYGWQPDGNQGVEYIVQVSPDKLAQVRDTGEITSTIPPELQGHVSRVVIRVGNAPLPKTVPASVQQAIRATQLSSADRQTMPIPKMDEAARVMKPQNGFSFPDPASRAGDRVSAGVNDAAQRLKTGVSSTFNDLRSAARDTSNNTAGNMRSAADDTFRRGTDALGNAGNDAMNRLGAGARDNKWLPLDSIQQRTDPTRTPSTDPMRQPDFVGPMRPADRRQLSDYTQAELEQLRRENASGLNTRFAGTRTLADESARRESQRGFGPNSNFGMVPAGMSSSDRLTVEEQRRRELASRQTGTGTANSEIGFADARLNLGNQRAATDQTRTQYDDRGFDDRRTTFGDSNRRLSTDAQRESYDPRYPADDRRETLTERDARTPAWATPNDDRSTNLAADRLRSQDVDPRLSKADVDRLPAGAWSFDEYGNPIDKQRRVLDHVGNPVTPQRAYELTVGRTDPARTQSNLANRNGMTVPGGLSNGGVLTLPGQPTTAFPGTVNDPRYASTNSSRANSNQIGGGSIRPSQSGSPITSPSDSGNGARQTDRQSLAAQPLFNFLLLMSIVANVYLVFWLKNLRHQFHDLVSSKRVAGGEPVGV